MYALLFLPVFDFEPTQNFIDPRNPGDPCKIKTNAPTSPHTPHNLAESGCVMNVYENNVLSKNSQLPNINGICTLLKRLAYACQFTNMLPLSEKNSREICLIFYYALDFIYPQHSHRKSTWNETILSPGQLLTHANTVHGNGVLSGCFGFIDGIDIPISRSNTTLLWGFVTSKNSLNIFKRLPRQENHSFKTCKRGTELLNTQPYNGKCLITPAQQINWGASSQGCWGLFQGKWMRGEAWG